jgi:hypothetical protein
MEKQLVKETKKYIKESSLSEEAKMQLLSLMDFINYPEVKQRILQILDTEEKLTDIEIQYLKELNKKFRNTDIFGYAKQTMKIPGQTRTNTQSNDTLNEQTQGSIGNIQPNAASLQQAAV